MAMTVTMRLVAAFAICITVISGSVASNLNLTLQLVTADFLPVHTLLHAAAEVWDLDETSVRVVSATARHAPASTQLQAGTRRLLEGKDADSKNVIEVDFAALHKEDPSLLTLKDFVMASNQAPNNPDDILSLLQAFAEFQQSQAAESNAGKALDDPLDTPFRNPSSRSALAAMKPSATSQPQHPAALSQAASNLPQQTSPLASDVHPHLLFLKTGGGSTVAQPKHQLTPQQLQMLADGTGTLEGLAVGPHLPLHGGTKPVVTQSAQEVMQSGLQGSSMQTRRQEPLGIATVVLDGEKNSQQFASLFTPRHDQAGMTLRQTAEDKPDVQGMFSSASQQEPATTEKARVRPSAKSLQGVYLDQPEAHKAGFPALEAAAAGRRAVFSNPDSLHWLDEVAADRAERAAQHLKDLQQKERKAATQGPWQLQREKEQLDGQLVIGKGSLLEAERQPASDVQRPSLSKAVLLTLVVNIAAEDTEALQKVIANTILDRQLQQHLGSKGFIITQLDASFDRQGFYSSNTGTFSVDVSEVFEGKRSEHLKVSVHTVMKPHAQSDLAAAQQDNTLASLQADKGRKPAEDAADPESSWLLLDLFICVAGFIVALAVTMVGVYKFNASTAGRQAAEGMASDSSDSFWICGRNPLRQPLIARYPAAAAEESC